MEALREELKVSFSNYEDFLQSAVQGAYKSLSVHSDLFFESYIRIASMEAWKGYVLEQHIEGAALGFFIESQNDMLLSNAFAKIGSWRAALKFLRSSLENILFCLYYKDHPVEYDLWQMGKHRPTISSFIKYLEDHPNFINTDDRLTSIPLLKKEYSTLSRAVHSSTLPFRMTKQPFDFPSLVIADDGELNKWVSREKKCLQIINQLLLITFCTLLQDAKQNQLRKIVSFVIPTNMHSLYISTLNIRLFQVPHTSTES